MDGTKTIEISQAQFFYGQNRAYPWSCIYLYILFQLMMCVGENFGDAGENVNGIVASTRGREFRLGIWTRTADRDHCEEIGQKVLDILPVGQKILMEYIVSDHYLFSRERKTRWQYFGWSVDWLTDCSFGLLIDRLIDWGIYGIHFTLAFNWYSLLFRIIHSSFFVKLSSLFFRHTRKRKEWLILEEHRHDRWCSCPSRKTVCRLAFFFSCFFFGCASENEM